MANRHEKTHMIRIGDEIIYVTKETADAYHDLLKKSQSTSKTNPTTVIMWLIMLGLLVPPIIWLFRWALGAL